MAPTRTLPIVKSELYRLGTKKDLARLLRVPAGDLKRLTRDENYREWPKREKNNKVRIIEEPLPTLKSLQRRLHQLLCKLETPSWLMSGKRGISPQDNARAHINEPFVVNVDIDGFFRNTKREFVYRCFQRTFGMRDDVASLLADLVTYKGHIPTGTPTSQLVAFWAYRPTFERLHAMSEAKGIRMTLWVDDITFGSTTCFPRGWTQTVNRQLSFVDLRLKVAKTKRYGESEHKLVTGSAITSDGRLTVRNAKRKEILDFLGSRRVENLSRKETQRLLGRLASQRQSDPDFFSSLYRRSRRHLANLNADGRSTQP